jgi:hypothetical protein
MLQIGNPFSQLVLDDFAGIASRNVSKFPSGRMLR